MAEKTPTSDASLFDSKQEKQIKDFLDERLGTDWNCPMCSHETFILGPYEARIQAGGALLGGAGYPMVVISCRKCSHSLLFSTLVMGLGGRHSEVEEGGDDDA